jgi:glycosyltransferase involved in cell wall biosynthesis
MTRLPRITVITPSYNQGAFIEQTIQSVLSQGYPDLEYIVMDGASTDNTLDVLRKYDGRLTWISEQDRGQSHAINKGFRMATGDVVAFLNSDDLYLPGALQTVGQYFASHPESAWLTGRCHIIDQDNRVIRKGITRYKNLWLRFASYQTLQITNYISQMATFWRREVIEREGEIDESLHYSMDYDFWLRVGRHYKLIVIDPYLACFRIHATSKAGASASAQFDAELGIIRRHAQSRLLYSLHRLHNAMIVATYRQTLKREVAGASRSH